MTLLQTRSPLGLEDWSPTPSHVETEHPSWSGSLREPEEGLVPVALTGGLVGTAVDSYGLPMPARVVVRDRNRAVVKECYTSSPRAGSAGGRFEVRGLPTGTYMVEIAAPGFAPEARHGVRIEAPCVTELGTIRLMRAVSPSITVQPRRDSVPLPLPAAWRRYSGG